MRGYDVGSARLMLAHLGRAAQHYEERQHARNKLKIELSRLKKISTGTIRNHLHDLERSIGEAIKKEQRILQHQQKEDVFHGDVKERIKDLEGRLARYLAIHEARAQRVRLLESALAQESVGKEQQFAEIKKSLSKVERIYNETKRDKKHSKKQLESIRKVIDSIKAKIRAAERKL